MRITTLLLTLTLTFTFTSANAGKLNPAEVRELKAAALKIREAYQARDVEAMMKINHPSLMRHAGGREQMRAQLAAGFRALEGVRVNIVEWSYGDPGDTYQLGRMELCVLPQRTILTQPGGATLRGESYVLALRDNGEGRWTFIDGNALHRDKGLLQKLLPDFPRTIKLPEVKLTSDRKLP